MNSFTLVTGNQHKQDEFKNFFNDVVSFKSIDLTEIQSLNEKEIALHKLQEARKHIPFGMIAIEDSSVYFGGFKDIYPGPLAKFFEQSLGIDHIYDLLGNRPDDTIRYVSTISIIDSQNNIHTFSGEVRGRLCSPRGDGKFGCDPIFMPNGFDKSFAQMSIAEKESISHRGKAMKKLKEFLESR